MATIKDVAREAGCSIATVSNYLNRTKPVSKEVSKAIQQAIEKLQYSHNMLARNFRTQKNMDIGVILPDITDSYYMRILQGIKSYFQNTDYYVNLEFSRNIPEYEKRITELFLRKKICGLILVTCRPDQWKFYYDNFTSNNIPIVLVDRNIRGLDANYVSFNNYNLMHDKTKQMLEREMKNLCLVSGPEKYSCEADFIHGFRNAHREVNIPIESPSVVQTDMSKEDAFRKTVQLLADGNPDVIMTTSETIANGVIEGMNILGYSVDDIPVISLGEEHWNSHTNSFSTQSVMRTAMELGRKAARLLEKQLLSPVEKDTERVVINKNPKVEGHKFVPFKSEKTDRKLRLLMLDTPQVHALVGLKQNFKNRTGIELEIDTVNHRHIYDTIVSNHRNLNEKPYDVFMYDVPWVATLASESVLENITQEIEELKDIFLPNCLEYFGNFKGEYYGLPFMYAPQILYYRKDLFEDSLLKAEYEIASNISLRPPVTLKEFNAVADYFTHKSDVIPYGISIPAAYSECLAPEIHMRLRTFGAQIFDEDGNVCFDSEATLKAYINFVRTLKSAKPDYCQTTDNRAVEEFMSGETAMLISYPSFMNDITDLRKNSIIGSIGYHMIPGRSPLLGGWGLGINKRSSQKTEAMAFLKWTCDEQVANYSTLLGGQSAIASAYENDSLVDLYPWLSVYKSMCEYMEPTMPPILPNGKVIPQYEIDNVICKWVYELMEDKVEVLEAIQNTQKDLEQLIKAYSKTE